MTRSMTLALLMGLVACSKDEPSTDDSTPQDELCDDGADNDADGDVDCEDPDCEDAAGCAETPQEDCADGVDNDGDGDIDCEDEDCEDDAACEAAVEDCNDGVDNDGDGLTDCEDDDCAGVEACIEDCADGVDNDLDGLTDCEDADCFSASSCQETCDDGVDNDEDSLTDCHDDDCWGESACSGWTLQVTGGLMRSVMVDTSVHWSPDSYAYGSYHSVLASSVQGVAWVDRGSFQSSCAWSVQRAEFSGVGSTAVGIGRKNVELVVRSGFVAECGLSSGMLPTELRLSGGKAFIMDSPAAPSRGPLWYGGSATYSFSDRSSVYGTSNGRRTSWRAWIREEQNHTGLSGEPWTPGER